MAKKKELKRIVILQQIFNCFQNVSQWLPFKLSTAVQYLQSAEALIKLLEVEDCGSTGGFDTKKDGTQCGGIENLYERFLFLCEKSNDLEKLKKECYFTPLKLKEYFDTIQNLRETYNR